MKLNLKKKIKRGCRETNVLNAFLQNVRRRSLQPIRFNTEGFNMAYFFPLTTEGQNFGHGWSFEKLCIIGGESYTNEMILATPYGLNNQNKFHFSLLKTVSQEG